MSDRNNDKRMSAAPLIVAIVLLACLALYVGAYVALLRPSPREVGTNGAVYIVGPTQFALIGRSGKRLFAPLIWVDMQLRPDFFAFDRVSDAE